MKSLRKLSHFINKLESTLFKDGTKIQFLNSKRNYAQSKEKFIRDKNGELMIPSPFGALTYPDSYISEYVWHNVNTFQKLTALECGITGRKYTYSQARDATNYIARSLRNLNFKEGDIIALIAPNLPEWSLAFLGILEAGLIVTTVNPQYKIEEIRKQLELSNAKGIITAREIFPNVKKAVEKIQLGSSLIVIDDQTAPMVEGVIPFQDLITRGKNLPPLKALSSSVSDFAILPFSSGTTGLPKGVMLTHNNLVANIEMVKASVDPQMWMQPSDGVNQEVIPAILPFFHIFGLNGVLLPGLMSGVKFVTIPRFQPNTFNDVLINHKPTIMFSVPPIIMYLSQSSLIKKENLSNLRAIFSGAAPISKKDVDRFYENYQLDNTNFKFAQGYGLTECSPVSFIEKTGLKYASIGKNVCGCDARLVDPITNIDIFEPGQNGELWIRGPHVMKGYYNNPKATKDILMENGWMKTGDIAYFDEDYDFFITDRLKELIKVKGFQVAPAELEAILRTHPDIQEAAVIGISDTRCGEVPRAFVIVKNNKKVSEKEVQNFVKEKVSEYKQLKGGVSFVQEIPKNPSGKILRVQIKKAYLNGDL